MPELHPAGAPASMAEAFQATASRDPDAVALRTPYDALTITWRAYAARVRDIATGLSALGVRRGDTVALMMVNRPEFHLVDAAAFHLGAVPFSIYNTSSPEQIAFVFASAKPTVVVCDEQFLPRLRQAAAGTTAAPAICVDAAAGGASSLAEIERTAAPGFDFEATWRAVRPDDVLTLIYTSGTTGDPKAVQITHGNMLAEVAGTNSVMGARDGDRIVSFLPSAHIADRWAAHYLQAVCGTQVTCVADRQEVMAALVDVRPTLFGAVPQMWQKIRAGIEGMVAAEPDEARRDRMRQAIALGRAVVRTGQTRGEVPAELAAAYREVDTALFRPIRASLGLDQARIVQSGAAPIASDVVEFFNAVGIPLVDVWGMSELSCVAALPPAGRPKIGTIGKALPGVEIAVAPDGELLVRGPTVMKGYLGRPDLTAQTVDAAGWLHTGDLGAIDDDGYIRVADRKKDLIINAHGKNMSPANIENAVKAGSALIGQVVAIGDGRPYNVALVVLDADASAQYAARRVVDAAPAAAAGLAAEMAADGEVRALVSAAVDRANATLSRAEQIRKFVILPTFWQPGSDLLTHTMKVRRRPVAQRYAAQIDAMYATPYEEPSGQPPGNRGLGETTVRQ